MPSFNFSPLNLSNLPINSKIVDFSRKMTIERERFDNDMYENVYGLASRAFPSFFYNPDFNFLGPLGYTPHTQLTLAGPVVSNWNTRNGSGNVFTFTPVNYLTTDFSSTGSNNYLNMNISTIGTDLYLYNVNYSATAQFNQLAQYNSKPVTFSMFYRNNSGTNIKTSFSAVFPIIEHKSQAIFLKNGINFSSITMQLPDYNSVDMGANPVCEFRYNIDDIYGSTADFDLFYIKGEFGDKVSGLNVDHILEQLKINALV